MKVNTRIEIETFDDYSAREFVRLLCGKDTYEDALNYIMSKVLEIQKEHKNATNRNI